jgi:hypothetical protein
MNSASYLFAGQSLDKALASLRAAHDLLPAQPTTDLLLGRAFLADGQRQALDVLPAAAWGDRDTPAAAKALLKSMGQH